MPKMNEEQAATYSA